MQHLYQHSQLNLQHDQQQQQHVAFNHEPIEPIIKRAPSPMLAERYLAAIQTNKTSNTNSSPNNNNAIVTKRPRPTNQPVNNQKQLPQVGHNSSVITSTFATMTVPMQTENDENEIADMVYMQQQNMATMTQSRNGSTSPSRGKMIRSESFQTRDSSSFHEPQHEPTSQAQTTAFYGSQQQQQGTGMNVVNESQHNLLERGATGGDSKGLIHQWQEKVDGNNLDKSAPYKRQWTPNQWRNFRTAQQLNAIPSVNTHHNVTPMEQVDCNHAQCTSPETLSTKSNDDTTTSNGSNTETDIVTNKAFDLKRRNWLTNTGSPIVQSSSDVMSLPKNKSRKTWVTTSPRNSQRKQYPQQQNQQEQPSYQVNSNNDECDNDSKDSGNPSVSYHKPLHRVSTPTSFNEVPQETPKMNNQNPSSSPLSTSPMSQTSRKWQAKILNDRGWIKQRNHGISNDGGTTDNIPIVSHLLPLHQEKESASSYVVQSSVPSLPSSPTHSLKSTSSIKKITSKWIDRVNAKTMESQKIDATKKEHLPNLNNANYKEMSDKKPQTTQYVPLKVQNGNDVKVEPKSNRFVWGDVKLRSVKEGANESVKSMSDSIPDKPKNEKPLLEDDDAMVEVAMESSKSTHIQHPVETKLDQIPSQMSITQRIKNLSGNKMEKQSSFKPYSSVELSCHGNANKFHTSPVRKRDHLVKNLQENQFLSSNKKEETINLRHQPKGAGSENRNGEMSSEIVIPEAKTVASDDSTNEEFQSVRSRLRNWKKKEVSESTISKEMFRSSPMRSSMIIATKDHDIKWPTKAQVKPPNVANEVSTNKTRNAFQKWNPTMATKSSEIKINKFKSFFNKPLQKGYSTGQNDSQEKTNEVEKIQPSGLESEHAEDNAHYDPKNTSNISSEFSSVKQRIKSLGDKNACDTIKKESIANQTKSQLQSPFMPKQSTVIYSEGSDKVNLSVKEKLRMFNGSEINSNPHVFQDCKKTDLKDSNVPLAPSDEHESDMRNFESESHVPFINNDELESRKVKNIKNLFEAGASKPSVVTKQYDHVGSNTKRESNDSKESNQIKTKSKFEQRDSTLQTVTAMNMDCERSDHVSKKSDVKVFQSRKGLPSQAEVNLMISNTKTQQKPAKSIVTETTVDSDAKRNSTIEFNQMKSEECKSEKSKESNDDNDIQHENFAFTSLKSKFEGIIATTRSKPSVNKVAKNAQIQQTISPKSLKIHSPPKFPKKQISEEKNRFRTIEMMQMKDEEKMVDRSPQTDCHDNRNLETPPNDIPWQSHDENRWSSSEPNVDSAFASQKPEFEMNDERMASNESGIEDEDCDGVTLSPTTSDVSCLSVPTCFQSEETSTFESSSSSDEDTGAMESGTDKQSSAKGASEASSSHTSEAAAPLINSTLGTMKLTMGRLNSNSDTTQSVEVAQISGLLNSIPPLTEETNQEDGLLLQNSQNPLQPRLGPSDDLHLATTIDEDLDFSPEWEANFSKTITQTTSKSLSFESALRPIEGFSDDPRDDGCESIGDTSDMSSQLNNCPSVSSSTMSSRGYRISKGLKRQQSSLFPSKKTFNQPHDSTKTVRKKIYSKDSTVTMNSKCTDGITTNPSNMTLQSSSSDRENKAPAVVTRKQIFKRPDVSRKSTRRFDIQKVKAHHLARRKSLDKNKSQQR